MTSSGTLQIRGSGVERFEQSRNCKQTTIDRYYNMNR
jgi:hypothetical protein